MYPDEWAKTGVKMWQGEYQFIEALGKKKATDFLHAHWDKWVTREDFERLKAGGITHLRIPIGYWILGKDFLRPNDTYIPGGWPYLERALGWASELGLKCIIDLHGAPGAQNGNDNSGFSGPYPCMHPPIPPPPPGAPILYFSRPPTLPIHPLKSGGNEAINWTLPENLQASTDVLVYLAKNLTTLNDTEAAKGKIGPPRTYPPPPPPNEIKQQKLSATNPPTHPPTQTGSVSGLCLLNEPWTTAVGGPIPLQTVKDWYVFPPPPHSNHLLLL